MAGKFMYFREDDGAIIGTTHGCTCCSNEQTVGLDEIDAHIASLRRDLEEAEAIRKRIEVHQHIKAEVKRLCEEAEDQLKQFKPE